jgi:hypothetical protein
METHINYSLNRYTEYFPVSVVINEIFLFQASCDTLYDRTFSATSALIWIYSVWEYGLRASKQTGVYIILKPKEKNIVLVQLLGSHFDPPPPM